mmetsp:Transcript_16197/g.31121  ORF Transcript_16197/g.31121 Transcript_16197/m.31121 type:complete len:226 (-) Transcript_16197:775-1452(-)
MNLVHSVAKAISVPFQASSAVNVTIPIAASWNQLMSKSASAAFSSSVPGDSNRESSHPSARKLAKLEPVSAEDDSKAGHGNAPWQVTGMGLGSDPACSDADVFALEEKDVDLDSMMRQLQGSVNTREVEQAKLVDVQDPELRELGRTKEDQLRYAFRSFYDQRSKSNPKDLATELANKIGVDPNTFWQALKHTSLPSKAVEHQVSEKEYIKRAVWPMPETEPTLP